MTSDRAAIVDQQFLDVVRTLTSPAHPRDLDEPVRDGSRLTARVALALLDSQMTSRHLDLAARWLRSRGHGFYTIGSSGHEGNAVVAEATRVTDPAFLHYRSGAFFVHRASKVPGQKPVRDVLLGVVASSEEPIAGGRHKVFGSLALSIPPQTSTIASHLPKAMGTAFALERAKRLGVMPSAPEDAIVVCSMGDASLGHSTAAGAIQTACSISYQRLPVPILFVCEDNGLGISVQTPRGFIGESYGARPGIRYFRADGLRIDEAYEAAVDAVDYVRTARRPAMLHLSVVRLLGHAGSDVEIAYRSIGEIRGDEEKDPLLQSARLVVAAGLVTGAELCARYERIRGEVLEMADHVTTRPPLRSAAEIMAPLAPRRPESVASEAVRAPDVEARAAFWGGKLPEDEDAAVLSTQIGRALGDLLVKYPELVLFGEDVAKKGGVYGVTRGLMKRAGVSRVFDTLLDEQSILGLAIGAGHMGLLPMPEIQYLAYLHNAEDQLRGEASSLQFFSRGQYRNPMVVRIAGYGYQKGFGGHFHNDNGVAVLRDIPGIVVASPSRGDDAVAMLRTCVASARVDGSVCVFLEPIALYPMRDLHQDGDDAYLTRYPAASLHVPIGSARVYGDGEDLLLVSFANGVRTSLRVARKLEEEGVRCRVLDLRWLAPLPVADLVREASTTGRVLVVDETRRSGGVSEGVFAALVDHGYRGELARVTSEDSFIPLGDAANLVLMSEESALEAARALVRV